VVTHVVAELDGREAIAEATRRERTTGAMSIMEAQHGARAGVVDERNREAGALAALRAERASLAAQWRHIESRADPLRRRAHRRRHRQRAGIRCLTALMVLCCDPLAIALTAAASARRSTPA
jgi:hypothetical protein